MPFTTQKNLLEANMNSFDDEELDAAFENIRYYAENGEDMWEDQPTQDAGEDTSAEPESNDKSQPTTDDDSSLVDDDYLDALYEKISE